MEKKKELPPFQNEPLTDFSKREAQEKMRAALANVRSQFGKEYLLDIGGKEIKGEIFVESRSPAKPKELIGRVAFASKKDVDQALSLCRENFSAWRTKTPRERASFLFKAASIMREERFELASWIIFEAGKSWREADAEVSEAIDFLEYYGREMIRLGEPQRIEGIPGEENLYFYQPRGIAAVIAPWNFPLAISAGMTSAALVTGNVVIYKPAEQTSVVGAKLAQIYRRAGFPGGVFHFLPGVGEEVGEYLARHPAVSTVVFTGSKAVGLSLIEIAGHTEARQRSIKKVIAEMGGKNAIIIDSDADLDEAVAGTVQSAFGYSGQKCSACSRVIVHEDAYSTFVDRLLAATKSLRVGSPEDPATHVGPVIDKSAKEKILIYRDLAKKEGNVLFSPELPQTIKDSGGHYVNPTLVTDVAVDSRLAKEEIFGPFLVVFKVKDFDQALQLALDTDYALTGGLFSRSPGHIERAKEEFRVGNLYINRKITGAFIYRQPFGGFQMSGVGAKAGGPDYLLQFMEPRTVTENTMRRGFAPQSA